MQTTPFDLDVSTILLSSFNDARNHAQDGGAVADLISLLEDNEEWLFSPVEFPGRIEGFEAFYQSSGSSISRSDAPTILKRNWKKYADTLISRYAHRSWLIDQPRTSE